MRTGASNKLVNVSYALSIYPLLGGVVKAEPLSLEFATCVNRFAMTTGNIEYFAVWLPQPSLITGIKTWMATQGSYTPSNNNNVGLYTYSAGTLTQVAVSANNGTLWQATAQTMITIPFISTYLAAAGLYFIALLWNASATTTAPMLACGNSLTLAAASSMDFTNSARFVGDVAAQTSLPSSQAMASVGAQNIRYWAGLY